MKKFIKIAAGALAAALTLSLGGIMACNSGVDYTFEAEDAETEGETFSFAVMGMAPAQVEENFLYNNGEEATEAVSGYGGFSGVGQKIIWTVTADADCEVTITLYAASAVMDMDYATFALNGLLEADLSDAEKYSFKVNDEEVGLTGTLPATDTSEEGMGTPGCWWHVGTATTKAKLKSGKNTIVLELVGENAGINVDKIVIKSATPLK